MKFDRIELTNYRCFESETVQFEPGVNVIHGLNGSGKSTLLEASFFALYGSDALRETGSNLEDIITNSEDEGRVTLVFNVGGDQYTVTRTLKKRGDRVSQTDASLETPDGVVDGVRNVDSNIESMTRMDATAFLNSAFVRQGEINTLVHSSSSERQRLIDRLLQLGKLEEYMDRASDVRVGVGRVRDKKENLLDDRQSEARKLRDANIEEALQDVQERIQTRQSQLATLRDIKSDYNDKLDTAKETINEQEELQSSLEEVQQSLDTVESKITDLESRRDTLAEERDSLQDKLDAKRDEIASFIADQPFPVTTPVDASLDALERKHDAFADQLNQARNTVTEKQGDRDALQDKRERLMDNKQSIQKEIASLQQKKDAKEDELESELRPELHDIQDDIASLQDKIDTLQETFTDAGIEPGDVDEKLASQRDKRDELVSDRASTKQELESTRDELDEAIELRDAGKCPRCGQDVDGSPHVDKIDDLEDRIAELESDVQSYDDEIDSIENSIDQLEELDDLADDLADAAATKRAKKDLQEKQESAIDEAQRTINEYASQIDEKQADIDALDEEIETVEDKIASVTDTLSTLQTRVDTLETHKSFFSSFKNKREAANALDEDIQSTISDIDHVKELLDAKEEQAEKLHAEKENIQDNIDETRLANARETANTVRTRIGAIDDAIGDVEDIINERQEQSGELRGKVNRLAELEDDIGTLQAHVDALDDLYEQMNDIENMYQELRGDLRQRNIQRLEELLNELFGVTYQNDAYDRIELDGEYNATIIDKTADAMEPDKLSGGESVLFNLSLRAAIYQLLVEGIGDSDTMPPLILDEPTAHLDEGHVEQIDDLVSRMRDIGVDQIVVVSHTEEIIDSSSHQIEVIQDSTTNRSDAIAGSQTLI